jgi:hypothetical protein
MPEGPKKRRRRGLPGPNFSDPHAVPGRPYVGRFVRLSLATRKKIVELHLSHNVGRAALAERFGVTPGTIKGILRAHEGQ